MILCISSIDVTLSAELKVDALVLKHAYAALVGFILEGVKTDAVPLEMQYES